MEATVVSAVSDQVLVDASIDASHHGVFDDKAGDPSSSIAVSAATDVGSSRRLSVTLPVNKYYVVDPGQPEWAVQDASVALTRLVDPDILGLSISHRVSATIPLSEYSRDNGRRTRLGTKLSASGSVGKVRYVSGVNLRYYMNEYRTTVATDGRGGTPLPWFSYGVSQSLAYSWHRKWVGTLSGYYSELWFEDTRESTATPWIPEHPYGVNLAASYTPHVGYAVTAGMSQGSRFEQNGRVEFVVFDTYTTTWFLTLSYSKQLAY